MSAGKHYGATQISVDSFDTTLKERLLDPSSKPQGGETVVYWLGQAGFVIEFKQYRILVDPYLSDSLAQKYRGTKFPHVRMMSAPILPDELDRVDLVLCTHRHTDHMDPLTLQILSRKFPDLRFVVPRASIDEAINRCGVGMDRLIPVNAGEHVQVLPGCAVSPVAAAHESLDRDINGDYPWLGYVIDTGSMQLYHSGDCVPYAGLSETLAVFDLQLAMLPVNGRDAQRSGNGVPGNFTLDEAITLCRTASIPAMIAHHFGLFDFNTVSPESIDRRIGQEAESGLRMIRAGTNCAWRFQRVRTSG